MTTITKQQFIVFLEKFDLSSKLNDVVWFLAGWELDPNKAPFPSVITIADRFKLSKRTIQRYLSTLTDKGVLYRKPRTRKNGSQTSNLFYFNIPKTSMEIDKKYCGGSFSGSPCHSPCHPLKHSFRHPPAKGGGIPKAKAPPMAGSSTPNNLTNFNSITKFIEKSTAHQSVKILTLEKAMRAFETGLDAKGQKIRDFFRYVGGILHNYKSRPYKSQRAHFSASGAYVEEIDLASSSDQSTLFDPIEIPF